ncbi:MAG: polysaccharide deacetylase family protein [Polyangiaceae bacterium]
MLSRNKRLSLVIAGFLLLGCAWGSLTRVPKMAERPMRVPGRPSGFGGPPSAALALAAPKTPREPILPVAADGDMGKAWLYAEGPHRTLQTGAHRYVTFTFDDGPGPHTTDAVLKVLKKYDVRAAFFLIGTYMDGDNKRAELMRSAAKHIVQDGHLIGNHTYTHRHLKGLAPEFTVSEIDESSDSIARVTGVRPTLFRPPYGELDDFAAGIVRQRNLQLVAWNLEAQDMLKEDAKQMEAQLRGAMDYTGGGIVLLHDVKWATVRALEGLLKWLRKNPWDPAHPEQIGYEIVDLPTYYKVTLESPQPYPTREALMHARAESWQKAKGQMPYTEDDLDRPDHASLDLAQPRAKHGGGPRHHAPKPPGIRRVRAK